MNLRFAIYDLRLLALCGVIGFAGQTSGTGAVFFATNSVNEVIASADSGDTILISGPAIIHEHVVVNKPLRIIGTNAPIIDADGQGTPLVIRAAGVEIKGLTLRGGGRDLGKTN
jgi:nitrous oxidase accessory protein